MSFKDYHKDEIHKIIEAKIYTIPSLKKKPNVLLTVRPFFFLPLFLFFFLILQIVKLSTNNSFKFTK